MSFSIKYEGDESNLFLAKKSRPGLRRDDMNKVLFQIQSIFGMETHEVLKWLSVTFNAKSCKGGALLSSPLGACWFTIIKVTGHALVPIIGQPLGTQKAVLPFPYSSHWNLYCLRIHHALTVGVPLSE